MRCSTHFNCLALGEKNETQRSVCAQRTEGDCLEKVVLCNAASLWMLWQYFWGEEQFKVQIIIMCFETFADARERIPEIPNADAFTNTHDMSLLDVPPCHAIGTATVWDWLLGVCEQVGGSQCENDPLSWPLQEPGSGQVGGLDVIITRTMR